MKVGTILTDNGREFCGTDNHLFELNLALNDIEHLRTKVKTHRTNGFIERFNKTVLDEFLRVAFRENFNKSVEALQQDLDVGLFTTIPNVPQGLSQPWQKTAGTILEYSQLDRHEP